MSSAGQLVYRATGYCDSSTFASFGTPSICRVDLAANRSRCLSEDLRDLDLSPGGEWLLFTANYSGQREVWKARFGSDGVLRDKTQLTQGPAGTAAQHPSWSSDGSWVVFSRVATPGSGTDGQFFAVRGDGDGLRALNLTGSEPAWHGGGPAPTIIPAQSVFLPMLRQGGGR
jgi:Tol biopolymer transport system component